MEVICFTVSDGECKSITLVEAHLEAIVCVGTLTIWRLAGHDKKDLGWHANRPLAQEALVLGTLDEVSAHFLESFHIAGSEVDTDLVDLGLAVSVESFLCGKISHFCV